MSLSEDELQTVNRYGSPDEDRHLVCLRKLCARLEALAFLRFFQPGIIPLPNGYRLSGGPNRSPRSPSSCSCSLSRSWTGSSPGAAAGARSSKNRSASQKRICVSALSALHKAFPLVFCGYRRFQYSTSGLCLPFFILRICSFIGKDLLWFGRELSDGYRAYFFLCC